MSGTQADFSFIPELCDGERREAQAGTTAGVVRWVWNCWKQSLAVSVAQGGKDQLRLVGECLSI